MTVGDSANITLTEADHATDKSFAGYAACVVAVSDSGSDVETTGIIMADHTADIFFAGYAAGVVTVGDSAATIFDAIISGIITADHAADFRISVNIGLRNSKIGNYRTLTNMAK